jgi:hypothetical protein
MPWDYFVTKKNETKARGWLLTPVILATHNAEIRKIALQSQPGKIVHETLSQKYPSLAESFKAKALSSRP